MFQNKPEMGITNTLFSLASLPPFKPLGACISQYLTVQNDYALGVCDLCNTVPKDNLNTSSGLQRHSNNFQTWRKNWACWIHWETGLSPPKEFLRMNLITLQCLPPRLTLKRLHMSYFGPNESKRQALIDTCCFPALDCARKKGPSLALTHTAP